MNLPPFFERISNAVQPVVGSRTKVAALLSSRVIRLRMSPASANDPNLQAGFRMAANLAARIYPKVRLEAPKDIVDSVANLISSINPECDVSSGGRAHAELSWGPARKSSPRTVTVDPVGWTIFLDSVPPAQRPTNSLTALVAAALGIGELFRTVFAEFLTYPRISASPGRFSLLNDLSADTEISDWDLGRVHLVGAGAIGQSFIYALSQMKLRGTLYVVDPEEIELSNLQRYVLSDMQDVGSSKCAIAARALKSSKIEVVQVQTTWGDPAANLGDVEIVCTALDSARDRIAVQSGLPKRIYNAWTQPSDLGWSRHERFGTDPCLACLYVPSGPTPSQHELIATALRQDQLRVLTYLTQNLSVDQLVRSEQIPKLSQYPVPPDAVKWSERAILEDIIQSLRLDPSVEAEWQGKQISQLYREGICGGAIVSDSFGEVPQDVVVPLAHQSALAGLLLAAELLFATHPHLRPKRPSQVESRLNVLAPLTQIIERPRRKTVGCICADASYIQRYVEKWGRS